ncbi:prolyl oligopeptidase family serine peptidase [bacterium]|nr:prolyl oligopeptidase family serine peptidase [bacterium]
MGISNLETMLASFPPYWERRIKIYDKRVGRLPRYEEGEKAGQVKPEEDWTDEDRADVEFLRSISPLYFADNVTVPMLIVHGANDQRVKMAESEQFVEALRERGIRVEYLLYENEGHGLYIPENRLDFARKTEKFLAEILGGRCEE